MPQMIISYIARVYINFSYYLYLTYICHFEYINTKTISPVLELLNARYSWSLNNISILAWKITWTEDCGGLHSIGLQRVRHDWVTKHIAEQHGLELCGSTYMWIFFHGKYYTVPSQLNPGMLNYGYRGNSDVESWL